jgi:hypothetical protein
MPNEPWGNWQGVSDDLIQGVIFSTLLMLGVVFFSWARFHFIFLATFFIELSQTHPLIQALRCLWASAWTVLFPMVAWWLAFVFEDISGHLMMPHAFKSLGDALANLSTWVWTSSFWGLVGVHMAFLGLAWRQVDCGRFCSVRKCLRAMRLRPTGYAAGGDRVVSGVWDGGDW